MFRPLRYALDRLITRGYLRLIDAGGRSHAFGDQDGAPIVVRLTDRRTEWQLLLNPGLAAGEAYMDGRLVIEQGTIYDFLDLILTNIRRAQWPGWVRLHETLRLLAGRLLNFNPRWRAKRNVAHHYDLDGSLYDLFLDRDRQYSCAYFEENGISLDAAQDAKKRHIAAKLQLRDGQRLLDIGSGWGGLCLYLAKTAHAEATGITLSEEQLALARERARAAGLAKAVKFELRDYRELKDKFDRIVSVGMFEHVGLIHYQQFFDQVAKLLAEDGVAVVHSIGRFDGPAPTNAFIAKYIFPGGNIPALSEVLPAVERAGLLVADIEILRLHYAMTLRHWRQRFRSAWHSAAERFGERFCRMWEYYLASAEVGFRHQSLMVFQLQLVKDQSVLPLTRDYIGEAERKLRPLEARAEPVHRAGKGPR